MAELLVTEYIKDSKGIIHEAEQGEKFDRALCGRTDWERWAWLGEETACGLATTCTDCRVVRERIENGEDLEP